MRLILMYFSAILFVLFPAEGQSQNSMNSQINAELQAEVGVGFRYSIYGARRTPNTKEYWYNAAEQMNSYFENGRPEFIWIVGNLRSQGCNLGFPAESDHPLIFSGETDLYEETFALFSKMGVSVWLSFEPGHAPVDELLHIILKQYSHHECIVGIGIDVEWNDCTEGSKGTPVTDEQALRWIDIAQQYNPDYQFMFRHWLVEVMPPNVRENVKFVSNSQMFPSLTRMVNEFKRWGDTFYPAPIGFQFGYPNDKEWWGKYENAPKTIADSLFAAIPNLNGLYWVDFSTHEVFPEIDPEKSTGNLLAHSPEWSVATDSYGSDVTIGKYLIENGVAEAHFNLAKRTGVRYPFVEMICKLEQDIAPYIGGSITYRCDSELLIKLSQADFGAGGNETYAHYQLLLPKSDEWNTVHFNFDDFEQPAWTPEKSAQIGLVKKNVDAVYLVPNLDYDDGESGTLRVKDLRLHNDINN